MPADLVSSATKLLTPELLSRIASALGLDRAAIEKAASAGIPGILAAFLSLVGRPGGAERLSDAVLLNNSQTYSPISLTSSAGPGRKNSSTPASAPSRLCSAEIPFRR
jgi:hypothetical protein